jgi:hypothetical protein
MYWCGIVLILCQKQSFDVASRGSDGPKFFEKIGFL